MIIDDFARQVKRTGRGIKLAHFKINILLFADDIVLLAENPEDLQHLLDVVYLFSMRWGFSWNIKKSNLMRFTSSDKKLVRKKVYLGPEELKQTNVYKYLGIELDHKLNY